MMVFDNDDHHDHHDHHDDEEEDGDDGYKTSLLFTGDLPTN